MSKLISLCFPIYNRIETFKYTFSRTIDEVCRVNSDEIEVVVSVNPDEKTIEETKKFLIEMQEKTHIVVNINETNIGICGNGRKVFELATGKYIWMIGDDDFLLQGCLDRILKVVHKHSDIGWIYLAYARLDGYPEDEKSHIVGLTSYLFKKNGYIADGKSGVVEVHNRFGGRTLFSSVNLFLKSAWQEVADENKNYNPQLGATFCAASKGGIYLDDNINVVAGGQTTWSGQEDYSNLISYFRDMSFAINHGFTESEINSMIRYRMRHDALTLWFRMYRLVLTGNEMGKQSLRFFFRIMPMQTVISTMLLPVIACYLFLRHRYRNRLNKKVCTEYRNKVGADPYVVSRLP